MLKKFIQYYKPVRKLLALDIFSSMMIAALDLVTPRFSSVLIDTIIPQQNLSLVWRWCFYLLIVYMIRVSLQYVVEYWGHVLGVKMEFAMRKKLFAHIQTLPISFFDNYKVGKLMSRLVNDLADIAEAAHHGPEDLLISIVLLVGSFTMMFITNWKLALVLAILVPIMIVVGVNRHIKFRTTFRQLRQRIADINAQAEDNFSGIRVVKAFTAEAYEEDLFDVGNQNFAQSRIVALKTMAEFGVSVKFFIYLIQLLVFLMGAIFIIQNEMTVGGLVEFMLYVQLFQQPINRISSFLMQYNQAMAGFERYLEILAIPSQQSAADAIELPTVEGEISFEHVSFSYGDERDRLVLNDINFKVKPGKTLALVGPSGGGKTTMASLIPRFYELLEGQICIDGLDIRKISIESLRKNIGIIQQDVFIFAGTIAENIHYGNPAASLVEVKQAAIAAEAWEFIESLPDGLDTYIGQRGVKLSGGQKQRISLARVFLKNPPILILDEATSALDNRTEKAIQNTLNKLTVGRTTIVIAHRLTTIEHADEILVVTKEGIVERGNHQFLYTKKGIYYQLHQGEHEMSKNERNSL